jgi:hypothetical protein
LEGIETGTCANQNNYLKILFFLLLLLNSFFVSVAAASQVSEKNNIPKGSGEQSILCKVYKGCSVNLQPCLAQ